MLIENINMKIYFCIVGILCAFVLAKCESHLELQKLFEECRKEFGPLPKDTFIKGTPNFDDLKVNGFCTCIMKKYGILVDGKVVAEKAIEFAAKMFPGRDDDSVKADIKECASKANEEKHERDVVGALGKCIVAKHPFPK